MAGASAAVAPSLGEAVFEGLVRNAIRLAERIPSSRVSALLSSTRFVRPQSSPFGDFGLLVASGSKPLPIAKTIREVAVFSIEEARERIKSFITGRFVPESVADLVHYLNERFLRLETRMLPQGATNFLVDKKTNRSVPAAQVDPRLSHKAMLLAELKGAMRRNFGAADPAASVHSWEGMKLVLENDDSGLGYTVVANQGWIGRVHAVASTDPAENLSVIRSARAKGIELVLPEARGGSAARGELIPGMPILVRSHSLKAEAIHPGLSHERLSKVIGTGMDEAFIRMADRARSAGQTFRSGPSNVVSIETFRKDREEFRRRFVRKAPVDEFEDHIDEDAGLGFGSDTASSKRDIVVRATRDASELYVFDKDLNEEVLISLRSLPEGRYRLENEAGKQVGWTEVGRGGAVRYRDMNGNLVKSRAEAIPAAGPKPVSANPARGA